MLAIMNFKPILEDIQKINYLNLYREKTDQDDYIIIINKLQYD
jgi:hypothetical protein